MQSAGCSIQQYEHCPFEESADCHILKRQDFQIVIEQPVDCTRNLDVIAHILSLVWSN